MGAVQRAIVVLDVLAEAGTELGTNEIARLTGVNASSISRLLSTLTSAGMTQRLPASGRYRLGLRILQLASAARETLDIRAVARPYLEEITSQTSETTTLSIPGEHDVMTLDFVQSPLSVRSVAEVGRNSVRHATAVGKVFLAHGGTPASELAAFTDRTIIEAKALDVEIQLVRKRGWGQALGEREVDLNAVAVPVLDRHRELIAIVGVQGPAVRFGPRAMRVAAQLAQEGASHIATAF